MSGIYIGYRFGYNQAVQMLNQELIASSTSSTFPPQQLTTPSPAPTTTPSIGTPTYTEWGGPQLWGMVNNKRVENGVNPLTVQPEICTIASIRLNELLELGKLDGHEGFSNLPERREDLKWIFEKYNLFEFLVAGARTPQEAVEAWNNTLAHKQLLVGGEYVWGCIYAQNGFGVAIAAY